MGAWTFPCVACFATGIVIRLLLFRTSTADWLSLRPEIASPLTSWNRAMEGLSLHKNDISPYTGDLFHETPLMLRVLSFISRFSSNTLILLFVGLDLLSGLILMKIANSFGHYLLLKQMKKVKEYSSNADKLILTKTDLKQLQFYAILVFSFNPYSIAACVAKSTAIFNNLAILLALYYMLKGKEAACVFFIAVAAYISLYPIVLVVPAAIMFYQQNTEKISSYVDQAAIASYTRTAVICGGSFCALLGVSYCLEGSFNFLFSTYGFILSVPDLTPNLGVFWYFFTEMFEHFRTFFICVFQINVVIYTVPLSVKLKEHPVFFFYMLVFVIGIFKSYPSYADVGLIFSLMPLWKHVFQYLRNTFVVGCMFISTTVFAPVLYYLWIYAGSANANFYFAIALAFSTAEIFLVTDLMFAFIRREFDLKHGTKHELPGGIEGQVILD